jgi:hypothetical protein
MPSHRPDGPCSLPPRLFRNLAQTPAQPASVDSAVNAPNPDGGVVAVAQSAPAPSRPALTQRDYDADPDGDIVHPHPLRPGELPEGATIRVVLLNQLSTTGSEKGEAFRSRVASDVLQGGQVLIPAGAEIDGRLAEVSSGHPGGHGSMLLRPETVILADGTRYQLHAEITATPGAKSKVGSEGKILPGSRLKRDGIEYGGAVGAGATTGAIVGGPVGAMTGGLIGAGVVTAHLLISHPQATLPSHKSWVPHPFHSFIVERVGITNPNQPPFSSGILQRIIDAIVHTMEEKERGMNRKEKGETRALGIKLSRTHPSPPTIFIFPLKTFADNYKNNEINNIRC